MKRLFASILTFAALIATTGCMSPPQNLDTRLTRDTDHGKYVLTLVPPVEPPAINALHTWQVKVASPEGAPVTQARISVDGGMPQHGHGLPTQPLVRRELAAGTYLVEGMKFSMTGWWEMKLAIDAPQGPDRVTFNVVVSDPAALSK